MLENERSRKINIESRFGLKEGRFTDVNQIFACVCGLFLSVLFYMFLLLLDGNKYSDIFTKRGPTQVVTIFFFYWSASFLVAKWLKLKDQIRLLGSSFISDRPDFVLGPSTVDNVLHNIYSTKEDPNHYILTNRIVIALSNLKNLGRITDVDEIFRSQGEMDESMMESSYTIINGFIWAIPVIGFVGTVLGLSDSISQFGNVLQDENGLNQIKESLRSVTAGLATAFETTLVALIAALILQILLTFVKKQEQDFLDDCSSYCLKNIVNRIRIPQETHLSSLPLDIINQNIEQLKEGQ